MNKKVGEKKPTLTERMDRLENKMDIVLDKFLAGDEPAEQAEKEPDRDAKGNVIKYYKFVSPNVELMQFTEMRSKKVQEGDSYTIAPPECCSFGRDSDGPPGFYKTADEAQAQRLRRVLEKLTLKRLPHVFAEVTDDPAFADF
jgi:hypothetical protein